MAKFQVIFSNNIELIFDLDHSVLAVDTWIKEIVKFNVHDLCPINLKQYGTISNPTIKKKIERLYELLDILNEAYPGAILKEELVPGKEQEIFNRMHVHFPNILTGTNSKEITDYAGQYNSLIHNLEADFAPGASRKLSILFDVHRTGNNVTFYDIDEKDYVKFTPFHSFGSLNLNYAHVGKSANTLYYQNDTSCPKEQFVPQSRFSASCMINFDVDQNKIANQLVYDNKIDQKKQQYLDGWKEFYEARGGIDFFKFEYNDPRIRLGSLKIGQLSKVTKNNIEIRFDNYLDCIKLRFMLLTNTVESFTILEI